MSTYYRWAKWEYDEINEKDTKIEPLCFIIVPNRRINDVESEIKEKDFEMSKKYNLVGYRELSNFLDEVYKNKKVPEQYEYHSLVPQIIEIFKNQALSEEEFYANLFLSATNNPH